MKIEKQGAFFKVDDAAQIAYGWAIVCTENGEEYTDLQGDHIPEDVMVAAAIDFAANSRVGKDMHAGDRVGEHLFIYPVTKQSAELGVPTAKTGLLVGFRPDDPAMLDLIKQGKRSGFSIGGFVTESVEEPVGKAVAKAADGTAAKTRRVFRSFKIQEISLVDTPAMEGAKVGYVKRAIAQRTNRVVKRQLATDEVDGHAHAVLIYEDGSLFVQHATSAGAEYSHSHGIITNADGSVSILADSGHTHELVGAAVIAVPADAVVVVQASASPTTNADSAKAAHAKSTRSAAIDHGSSHTTEKSQMPTEHETKIADLTAKLAKAERLATLTDAQRAHYSKLGADGEAYLAKSFAERQAVLDEIEKANEVVYTSKSTGEVFRKSDDARLVTMAKRQDEQAAEIAKRDEAIEKADIRKRAADTIGKLAGTDAVHDLIVRSVLKSGAKQEDIDAAFTAMKGWNTIAATKERAPGVNPGTDPQPTDALAEFNAGVAAYAEKHAIKDEGLALEKFLGTTEGRVLKRKYDETRGYGKHLA